MKDRVLLIEDDDAMRSSLTQSLELEDMVVLQANGLAQARRSIRASFPGVIVSDIRMPTADGFAVLERAKSVDPDLPVIFLTGEADVPMAVRALQNGAYDFLEKPCAVDTLVSVVRRALRHRDVVLQARRLETILEHSDAAAIHFPGTTAASAQLRRDLRRLSELTANVHLCGEDGSGRRLAAHTIHFMSDNDAAAVSVNFDRTASPARLPDAGAMTGRVVILKNIERAAPDSAVRIIEAARAAEGCRVLSTSRLPPRDLPVWSALFAPLDETVTVHVPGLSERRADLPVIFESLTRQAARNFDVDAPDIPPEITAEITARDWRGNLPELRRRARELVLQIASTGPDAASAPNQGFVEQVQTFEKSLLINALRVSSGQASRAAETLQLPRKTFYDKLAKYGIEPRSLRDAAED